VSVYWYTTTPVRALVLRRTHLAGGGLEAGGEGGAARVEEGGVRPRRVGDGGVGAGVEAREGRGDRDEDQEVPDIYIYIYIYIYI
jgi:hypothetical protein